MYIMDFLKNILRKSNIPVLIYLVVNALMIILVIGSIFASMANGNVFVALLTGTIVYMLSLSIALSPVGEFLIRQQNGCRKITDPKILGMIEPIFVEVYQKARQMNPNIPDDVDLYMNDSEDVNAFATGRRTVCVTQGMLKQPPELIKATLGHEMGHLAHHDTDLILVVVIGNMVVNAFFIVTRFIMRVMTSFISLFTLFSSRDTEGIIAALMIKLSGIIADVIFVFWMNLWTKIGTLLIRKSSRGNEYEADEFSFRLGYGRALCELLDSFPASRDKGLFANLMATHPDKNDRIARLRQLGVNY